MADILLSTLNARYSHASLGLRYLRANLGELRERSAIAEFVIGQKTEEIVEKILARGPRILGFGVYIWNVEETTRLVAQLKLLAPGLVIVVGNPDGPVPVLAGRTAIGGQPTAYVCRGSSCSLPLTSAASLAAHLAGE